MNKSECVETTWLFMFSDTLGCTFMRLQRKEEQDHELFLTLSHSTVGFQMLIGQKVVINFALVSVVTALSRGLVQQTRCVISDTVKFLH